MWRSKKRKRKPLKMKWRLTSWEFFYRAVWWRRPSYTSALLITFCQISLKFYVQQFCSTIELILHVNQSDVLAQSPKIHLEQFVVTMPSPLPYFILKLSIIVHSRKNAIYILNKTYNYQRGWFWDGQLLFSTGFWMKFFLLSYV